MRVITWNCNMAFRKKYKQILPYDPDLLIVSECEHPEKFNNKFYNNVLWIGNNKNKGLRLSQNSSGLYIWVINIGIFIFFKDIYYMKSIILKKINSSVSHVQKVLSKAAIFTSIESGRVCF
jgi:hypothetical protein